MPLNRLESWRCEWPHGILFNHESPRRGIEFVSREITQSVAKIKLGRQRELRMGNLEARRDWGFAGDYVKSTWQMLQQERPDDCVIGTGIPNSVADLFKIAFRSAGLEWREFVKVDGSLLRLSERPVSSRIEPRRREN